MFDRKIDRKKEEEEKWGLKNIHKKRGKKGRKGG